MDIVSLTNRCIKRHKQLRKWARREGITCYRIYDRDIPACPLSIDLYELLPMCPPLTASNGTAARAAARIFMERQASRVSANDAHIIEEISARQYLVVSQYASGRFDHDGSAESNLLTMAEAAALAEALGIDSTHVIMKSRQRGKGGSRYAQLNNERGVAQDTEGVVYESGLIYKVNLSRRIDTGLFLDHRLMRKRIMEESRLRNVLNLFCYTGSLTVAAAAGGAASTASVDLSATYLEWAKYNMALNNIQDKNYTYIKMDAVRFLDDAQDKPYRYDIIILDPPTFSNSASAPMLDLNHDWPLLVDKCARLLADNGVLYFSTNSRSLRVKGELLTAGLAAVDITAETTSPDFPLHKSHRAWRITHL